MDGTPCVQFIDIAQTSRLTPFRAVRPEYLFPGYLTARMGW